MKWTATKTDYELASKIADRALELAASLPVKITKAELLMDLIACHCNGCELKLHELATAKDGDLGHDVFGIRRHIDRSTGQLDGCFLPRYAA